MRLALQLLTFNRPETLPPLFDSLAAQTDQDWTLYVLDNSTDPANAEAIAAYVETQKGKMSIVFERSAENIGFDAGHQHLYEVQNADYVMCINDDAFLAPDFLERVCGALDEHPKAGSASGAILRWHFGTNGEIVKTNIVDSLGLAKTPWHHVYDIAVGTRLSSPLADGVRSGMWNFKESNIIDSLGLAKTPCYSVFDIVAGKKILHSRPDPITGVVYRWGVSGCLPIYRRAAVGAQLFDPAYFLYKEDVDLAYRLNKAGWTSLVVPSAIAYHQRTFSFSARKKPVPFDIQWLSYRNHWRNLKKHLTMRDWLLSGWMILPYEVAKFAYLCYKYPKAFLSAVRREWL